VLFLRVEDTGGDLQSQKHRYPLVVFAELIWGFLRQLFEEPREEHQGVLLLDWSTFLVSRLINSLLMIKLGRGDK